MNFIANYQSEIAALKSFEDCLALAQKISGDYRADCPAGLNPQNTGVALGVAVAGTVAAGAAAYSASEQSSAAAEANATNANNAKKTNQLNLQMFREGRGSTGSAILPIYLKRPDGSKFEEELGQRAMQIYDATSAIPQDEIAANQALIDRYSGMEDGANETAHGIFNGDLEREALASLEPVARARNEGAAARKQAGLEGLQATLNEIKAVQAGKGFSGDSFGNRLLQANVQRKVLSDAATDQALVNERNASDKFDLKQKAIALRLGSLDLPYSMAKRSIDLKNLANNTVLDSEARRQKIFDYFRIAPQQYTYAPLPEAKPTATTGQIVGQTIGQLAGTAGNLFAAQYFANQMNQNGT